MPLTLAAFQGSDIPPGSSQQAGFPESLGTYETSHLHESISPNLEKERDDLPLICGDYLCGL